MKYLHFFFAFIAVLLLCPLSAHAVEDVAQIGQTTYSSLSEALEHAQPYDTLELIADATCAQSLSFPADITLDGANHSLYLTNGASLRAEGNFYAKNVTITAERSVRSNIVLELGGDNTDCTLSRVNLFCPSAKLVPNETTLISFSGSSSTLSIANCLFESELNGTTGIAVTGDCSESEITLQDVTVSITSGTQAARSCFAIDVDSTSDPALLSLVDCNLNTPTAGLRTDSSSQSFTAELTDCSIYSGNPLRISGQNGDYDLTDCILSDTSTDNANTTGLVLLSTTAEQNTVTVADCALISGSDSAVSCTLSAQNTENTITLTDQTSIDVQADCVDFFHLGGQPSDIGFAEVEPSTLSAFPLVLSDSSGQLRNACTQLDRAATLWQEDDTITFNASLSGALDLQFPLTIEGNQHAFSGSLAIRAPGTTIHELDLSRCAVDSVADCDLSLNYWGALPRPSAPTTSPYYADSDFSELTYAPGTDADARAELESFIRSVEQILVTQLPGTTLSGFDPRTAGTSLQSQASALLALCRRLSQTTTAEQRSTVLQSAPALAAQMRQAWRVYWCGVGVSATNTVIQISDALAGTGTDALRTAITQNRAALTPVYGISSDGTQLAPSDSIYLCTTLTDWSFDSIGQVQSLTFETELRRADGTTLEGDGVYCLPIPTADSTLLSCTVNGSTVPASAEQDGVYRYVTLSDCGTVVLSLQGSTTPPDNPDNPDEPGGTPSEPDEDAITVLLQAGAHGRLYLKSDNPVPGDTVHITIKADTGYTLDTLTVMDLSGRSIDFDADDTDLYFTMPDQSVRVTARFIRTDKTDDWQTLPDMGLPDSGTPSDVMPSDWYAADVAEILARGWMTCVTGDLFQPNLPVSRGDLILALYRMAGEPQAFSTLFTDIPLQSPYAAASIWARAAGVAIGEPDGSFRPYDAVTREECAALLHRFAGLPTAAPVALPFTDWAQISDWALPAMRWAYASGILYGNAEGTCTPHASITRAETAALLLRLSAHLP